VVTSRPENECRREASRVRLATRAVYGRRYQVVMQKLVGKAPICSLRVSAALSCRYFLQAGFAGPLGQQEKDNAK